MKDDIIRQFYDNLHASLREKYNAPYPLIEMTRSFALGQNMTREEIMDWADNRIREYKAKHWYPKRKWKNLFDFLEGLSDEAWNDITQKTEYDK